MRGSKLGVGDKCLTAAKRATARVQLHSKPMRVDACLLHRQLVSWAANIEQPAHASLATNA